jgi:hypothetical protein
MSANSYLYHIAPKDFKGTTLYPLNVLKDVHPDLYAAQNQKYDNREHVKKLFIPQLNCYWGDVLHFSAVPPDELVKALSKAGFEKKITYFEIDPGLLDPEKTIVYLNKVKEDKTNLAEDDFVPFVASEVGKWGYIPDATIDYYRKKFERGEKPLLFLFVPHILYKGSLDVSGITPKTTK